MCCTPHKTVLQLFSAQDWSAELPAGLFSEYHAELKCFLCGFSRCRTQAERKDAFDDILFYVSCPSPELTWRDVQHLIAKTAKIPDPKEPGWNINAAGYHVHHRYRKTCMQHKHVALPLGLVPAVCQHLAYLAYL